MRNPLHTIPTESPTKTGGSLDSSFVDSILLTFKSVVAFTLFCLCLNSFAMTSTTGNFDFRVSAVLLIATMISMIPGHGWTILVAVLGCFFALVASTPLKYFDQSNLYAFIAVGFVSLIVGLSLDCLTHPASAKSTDNNALDRSR